MFLMMPVCLVHRGSQIQVRIFFLKSNPRAPRPDKRMCASHLQYRRALLVQRPLVGDMQEAQLTHTEPHNPPSRHTMRTHQQDNPIDRTPHGGLISHLLLVTLISGVWEWLPDL